MFFKNNITLLYTICLIVLVLLRERLNILTKDWSRTKPIATLIFLKPDRTENVK